MDRRRGRRVREAWLGAGLLLAGGGCFGQPLGPDGPPPEDLDLYSLPLGINMVCQRGVRTEVRLDSLYLGYSPESILAFAEGKHTEQRVAPADLDADDPAELLVEVESLADGAFAFEPQESGVVGHGLHCDPWLEIGVRVAVKTSDGALDARFDATLFALHPDVAILYARPDGVDLQLALSPYGVSALLWEDDTSEFADTEPSQRYAAPDCNRDAEADFSVPLDAKHYGMTAQGLVDRMQDAAAFDVLWADGTRAAATASFQATTEHGCLAVTSRVPGNTRLSVGAQLDLVTGDGRFAGVLPGTIMAESEGALSHGNPAFWMDTQVSGASKAAGMGFTEYADRTDLDLEVLCSIQLDAAERVVGDLALHHRPENFCVPLEPDSGVPCSDDLINLESAQLVGR